MKLLFLINRFWLGLFIVINIISVFPQKSEARDWLTFSGDVSLVEGLFNVSIEKNGQEILRSQLEKKSESFILTTKFDHFQTPLFELSSQVEAVLEKNGREGRDSNSYNGRLSSKYTLLDFKPIKELSGRFDIEQERFQIKSLNFSEISCLGTIGLKPPYNLDLTFLLNDIGMAEFIDFWMAGRKFESSGTVTGEIKLYGNIFQPSLRGNLTGTDGVIKNLAFDEIRLNADGKYPILEIDNSTVSKTNGFMLGFKGPINLSNKERFKQQLSQLVFSPIVDDNDEKVEWTLKRLKQDESNSIELKYQLRKGERLSSDKDLESDILGLQQTMEF